MKRYFDVMTRIMKAGITIETYECEIIRCFVIQLRKGNKRAEWSIDIRHWMALSGPDMSDDLANLLADSLEAVERMFNSI